MTQHERFRPRARTKGVVVVELPEEMLVYDQVRHRAHCLNPSAAFVWKQCDGQATVATIARQLGAHTGTPPDDAVIEVALAELRRARLLVEPTGRRVDGPRLSRREALKRAGLAAAVALPLVTSIAVPTASAQASCLPLGAPTPTSSLCCTTCSQGGFCAVCAPP